MLFIDVIDTGANMSREMTGSTVPSSPDTTAPSSLRTDGGTSPSSRLAAVVLGAILSFFVGWVPLLGPIAGGVLAGYLRGEDIKEGAITGTLANFLATLPSIALVALLVVLGALGATTGSDADMTNFAIGMGAWLLILAVSFVYYWCFGALGGVLGAAMSDRGYPA